MRIQVLVCVGAAVAGAAAAVACGGTNEGGFGTTSSGSSSGTTSSSGSGSTGSSSGGSTSGSSSGSFGSSNGGSSSGTSNGPPLIYAHTDTELYSMDPNTHQLTDIGAFQVAGAAAPTITDLAVDANDDVWVNSETAIYRATLPAGGTGPVSLTLATQLTTSTKFYALGFAPAGVLGSGEALIAGDSAGDLYYIDTSGASATPQNLGGFGSAPGGGTFQLSGDVVFYTLNGSPMGLATVRACTSKSCSSTNDSLVQVDIAAMQQAYQSKTPAASLLKANVGSGGTGYGRLFGVGAWGDSVYAFSRESSGSTPAQLVQIGSAGTGTVLQSFSNITSGWSGAGVTTKATVTVVQ